MHKNIFVFFKRADFLLFFRKFNVFIYGCENRRHSEKYLKEQIFPLMLHKNTAEKFSFEDCELLSLTSIEFVVYHRHPREIDCSLAAVGRPAAGTESRGKSKH